MPFDQFFPILAMSAMTVVAALLAWTVKQVLTLTTDVAALSVSVTSIKADNAICEADRSGMSSVLIKVREDMATVTERSFHQTKSLERIEAAITKPAPRARATK